MTKIQTCQDRYHEPLFRFRQKLRERIRQKKLKQRLIRPEVNWFFTDRQFWEKSDR
jgi:hypothetical protein